jgi:tetratricopeptide (TPR) repeat protein
MGSRPAPERIYGFREIVRILTLTPKRSAQLRRLGLLHGDSGYTFRDLLALRAAGALLDAGASVRQMNAALTAMRRQDPALDQPLAAVRFVVDGGRLLAQSDSVRFDPRTGQTVLDLDAGGLRAAAAATFVTGMVRPLGPPTKQADTWFERAMEWDADPAQWEEAIEAYRRVVSIDPSFAAAWNNLGLLLHRMGQYDEARTAYGSALAADPRCREAAYNLGSLQEDCGDVEAAIGHYRRALELSPDYADAHFNLAAALARAGRPADAVDHWRRYLLLDPGSSWAKIARSHLEIIDPPEGRDARPGPRAAATDRWGLAPEWRDPAPGARGPGAGESLPE